MLCSIRFWNKLQDFPTNQIKNVKTSKDILICLLTFWLCMKLRNSCSIRACFFWGGGMIMPPPRNTLFWQYSGILRVKGVLCNFQQIGGVYKTFWNQTILSSLILYTLELPFLADKYDPVKNQFFNPHQCEILVW